MSEEARCSFCHRSHVEVFRVITGSEKNICNQCLDDFYPTPSEEVLYKSKNKKTSNSIMGKLRNFINPADHVPEKQCSFCQRIQPIVKYLVTNETHDAFICNYCLKLSKNIVNAEKNDESYISKS